MADLLGRLQSSKGYQVLRGRRCQKPSKIFPCTLSLWLEPTGLGHNGFDIRPTGSAALSPRPIAWTEPSRACYCLAPPCAGKYVRHKSAASSEAWDTETRQSRLLQYPSQRPCTSPCPEKRGPECSAYPVAANDGFPVLQAANEGWAGQLQGPGSSPLLRRYLACFRIAEGGAPQAYKSDW